MFVYGPYALRRLLRLAATATHSFLCLRAAHLSRSGGIGNAGLVVPLLVASLAAGALVLLYDARAASAEPERASELPGPVTSLFLVAAVNSATVGWSAPETGGAPSGYIVHIRPEDGKTGSGRTKTPKAKKTAVTFDNLEAGRTYKVWVRARNEAGKGERAHGVFTLSAADAQPDSFERPPEGIYCYDLFSTSHCDSFR